MCTFFIRSVRSFIYWWWYSTAQREAQRNNNTKNMCLCFCRSHGNACRLFVRCSIMKNEKNETKKANENGNFCQGKFVGQFYLFLWHKQSCKYRKTALRRDHAKEKETKNQNKKENIRLNRTKHERNVKKRKKMAKAEVEVVEIYGRKYINLMKMSSRLPVAGFAKIKMQSNCMSFCRWTVNTHSNKKRSACQRDKCVRE